MKKKEKQLIFYILFNMAERFLFTDLPPRSLQNVEATSGQMKHIVFINPIQISPLLETFGYNMGAQLNKIF